MKSLPDDRRSVVARVLKRYIRGPSHGPVGESVLVALEKWIGNGSDLLPVEVNTR